MAGIPVRAFVGEFDWEEVKTAGGLESLDELG